MLENGALVLFCHFIDSCELFSKTYYKAKSHIIYFISNWGAVKYIEARAGG